MPKTLTVRGEPILLDAVLAAEFGPATARELLVATLDLNPGLADAGPVLPVGRTIVLPDPPSAAVSRRVVSLFG